MEAEIEAMLAAEQQPENIEKLRRYICGQLKYSRGQMSKRHEQWDINMAAFESKMDFDQQDAEARRNKEPQKQVVPMSYTQVMTFCTFAYMLLNQNELFFQMEATGNEDYPLTEASEITLARDLRHNQWHVKLFELLQDFARFGLCATKDTWVTEEQYVEMPGSSEPVQVGPFATLQTTPPEQVPVIKFEGNRIVKISPFRIIPDMRLPLTRWREGKYIADETEFHIDTLKEMEAQGLLIGTEFIEKMAPKDYTDSNRGADRFRQVEVGMKKDTEDSGFMVILTEGQFLLNPTKFGLGDENYECPYIITMANDGRITSINKAGYLHGEFIYDIAQFSPDEHSKLSLALSDVIDKLQETITWLINARIISLRQGLDRHLVTRPEWVDPAQLESRSPAIFIKPGAPQIEINKLIQQLQIDDKTEQNIPEAETLMRIVQLVSGINENAMGQYAPGRRSATENRNANAGASARMTLHVSLFFEQLLQPLGRKMLVNQRQGMSIETFVKVVGKSPPNSLESMTVVDPTTGQPAQATIEDLFQLFAPADPTELVGNEDFFTSDLTSGSERAYLAQNLQELVLGLVSNPQVAMMTQYDITKLIDEIQFLRGVRNVARFKRIQPAVDPAVFAAAQAGGVPANGAAPGLVPPGGQQGLPAVPPGAGAGLPVGA